MVRNIVVNLVSEVIREVKAHLRSIFEAPTYEGRKKRAKEVLEAYQELCPSAIGGLFRRSGGFVESFEMSGGASKGD